MIETWLWDYATQRHYLAYIDEPALTQDQFYKLWAKLKQLPDR